MFSYLIPALSLRSSTCLGSAVLVENHLLAFLILLAGHQKSNGIYVGFGNSKLLNVLEFVLGRFSIRGYLICGRVNIEMVCYFKVNHLPNIFNNVDEEAMR